MGVRVGRSLLLVGSSKVYGISVELNLCQVHEDGCLIEGWEVQNMTYEEETEKVIPTHCQICRLGHLACHEQGRG